MVGGVEKQKALPRWRSHKVVEGFKIAKILRMFLNRSKLVSEDGQSWVSVDDRYLAKHSPLCGGYFVRYEDGYESFSPAAAFEGGYTSVDVAGPGGKVNADLINEPERDAMGERTSQW